MSTTATEHEEIERQEQKIIDRLEKRREDLEEIAQTDTRLGERCQYALEWLDEHQGENDA